MRFIMNTVVKNPPKIEQNVTLKDYSTFGIGGPARYLAKAGTVEQLREFYHFANAKNIPVLIIGKGSNVLFDDQGFYGFVVINRIRYFTIDHDIVHVSAGYSFSSLGIRLAKMGYSGLEFAAGIPGSVGGAIYMNAGACGLETKDCLLSVQVMNHQGLRWRPKEELFFAYRNSSFQENNEAIISAKFRLGKNPEVFKQQQQQIRQKIATQPYSEKSCGCIFQNPQGKSAGKIIEQCGLKGMQIGDAKVSQLHGNFIINVGESTAEDVKKLIEHIQSVVHSKMGIHLEKELRCIPYKT